MLLPRGQVSELPCTPQDITHCSTYDHQIHEIHVVLYRQVAATQTQASKDAPQAHMIGKCSPKSEDLLRPSPTTGGMCSGPLPSTPAQEVSQHLAMQANQAHESKLVHLTYIAMQAYQSKVVHPCAYSAWNTHSVTITR